jgi:hypothetical protein
MEQCVDVQVSAFSLAARLVSILEAIHEEPVLQDRRLVESIRQTHENRLRTLPELQGIDERFLLFRQRPESQVPSVVEQTLGELEVPDKVPLPASLGTG